jgi:hypothetical protein
MLQVVIGPKFDVTLADVQALINLGYVYQDKKSKNNEYRCLSEDFTSYLYENATRDQKAIIWPNVTDAEKHLRYIIKTVLKARYGAGWEEEIRSLFDTGKLKQVDNYQESNLRNYSASEQNILQSLSIMDLANIIEYYWENGIKNYFPQGADKQEWKEKIKAIYHARIPITHSNPEFLSQEMIGKVNRYCEEIRQFPDEPVPNTNLRPAG